MSDPKVLLNNFNNNHFLNNLKNIHLLSDEKYLYAKVLKLKPIYTQLQDALIKLNILNKEAVSVILSHIVFLLLLIVPEKEINKLSTILKNLKKIINDFMNEQSGGIKIEVDGEEVYIKTPEKFNWKNHINTVNITINILTIIILILFLIANVFSLRDLLFNIVPIAPNANNDTQMANNTFALVTLPNKEVALYQPDDASKFVKEHVLGNQLLTSGVIAMINKIMNTCGDGCDKSTSNLIIVELENLQKRIQTLYDTTFTGTAVIAGAVIEQSVNAVVIFCLKTVFGIDNTKPNFLLQKLLTDEANTQIQHMLKHTKLDVGVITEKYLSENYKKMITLLKKKQKEDYWEKMVTAAESVIRVTNIDVLKHDITLGLKSAFNDLKKISGYYQIKIGAEQIKTASDLIIENYINDVSNKVIILNMLLGLLATSTGYLLWELIYIYNTRKDFNKKRDEYVIDYLRKLKEVQDDNDIFRDSDQYDDDDKEQRATRSKQGTRSNLLPYKPTGANVSNVKQKNKTRTTISNKQQEETGIKQLPYYPPTGGNKKSLKNKTKKNKRKNRKNKTYKK